MLTDSTHLTICTNASRIWLSGKKRPFNLRPMDIKWPPAQCASIHPPPGRAQRVSASNGSPKKGRKDSNAKLVCTITMLKQDLEEDAATSNLE